MTHASRVVWSGKVPPLCLTLAGFALVEEICCSKTGLKVELWILQERVLALLTLNKWLMHKINQSANSLLLKDCFYLHAISQKKNEHLEIYIFICFPRLWIATNHLNVQKLTIRIYLPGLYIGWNCVRGFRCIIEQEHQRACSMDCCTSQKSMTDMPSSSGLGSPHTSEWEHAVNGKADMISSLCCRTQEKHRTAVLWDVHWR